MTSVKMLSFTIASLSLIAISLWLIVPRLQQKGSHTPHAVATDSAKLGAKIQESDQHLASAKRDEPEPQASNHADIIIPVAGINSEQLLDTFAQERDGGSRGHEGIDIMAPTGTPIVSAAPGTVEKLFSSDAGGKTVYIRSEDRRRLYYYAHLDDYSSTLSEAQVIAKGKLIGTVGYSGNANPDGPHLHFEIRDIDPDYEWYQESRPLNPYSLLVEP